MADAALVLNSVKEIAGKFASQQHERQLRPELDAQDFTAFRDVGFLLTGVPVERDGLWVDIARSTRPLAESSVVSPVAILPSPECQRCAQKPCRFSLATSEAPAHRPSAA
jgi:hypothetical protein